jgi:hypothetical protein
MIRDSKKLETKEMKTKLLTFLLSLTFLFLFSGNSFGGIFDKKDENVVLRCLGGFGQSDVYYSVNIKDKTITEYMGYQFKQSTYKIERENEIFLFGVKESENGSRQVRIDKHEYKNIIPLTLKNLDKEGNKIPGSSTWDYDCIQGVKKF